MVYIVLSAKRRAYFCQSIAIQMGGGVAILLKASGSGVDWILLILNGRLIFIQCWYWEELHSAYEGAKLQPSTGYKNRAPMGPEI